MASSETLSKALVAHLEELHQDSFAWALTCCGWNHADAEDVLQATYLKVASGQARFEGRSAVRTWLFGVIRRTAQEHRRRMRSEEERVERMAWEVPQDTSGPEDPGVAVEQTETARLLREAMEVLPPRQREVVHLVYYEDLSVTEAARVMGVSAGSARVHFDRGKRRLRALLSGRQAKGELR